MSNRLPVVDVSGKQKELPAGDDLKVQHGIVFPEITTPATPAAGTVLLYPKADGNFYQLDDTGTETNLATSSGSSYEVISFGIISDSILTAGGKASTLVVVPYGATILSWWIICDVPTTAVLDIWFVSGGVPTNGDSITAAAKPSVTAATYATSSSLPGWITALSAGHCGMLEVESNSAAKIIKLFLYCSIP